MRLKRMAFDPLIRPPTNMVALAFCKMILKAEMIFSREEFQRINFTAINFARAFTFMDSNYHEETLCPIRDRPSIDIELPDK